MSPAAVCPRSAALACLLLRPRPRPRPQGHINQLMAANNLLFSCSQDNSIRVWGMEGEAFVCKVSRRRLGGVRWAEVLPAWS